METLLETHTLRLTVRSHRAHLELTRPELMNRFDDDQHADFLSALRVLSNHHRPSDIRVIMLSAYGSVFSAGGDIETIRKANGDPAVATGITNHGYDLMTAFLALRAPVVTAVQGAAMGLAANIALASDLVVASRDATFADSHVRMGLVAGDGGALIWPLMAGMARAKRHLLTGDAITAEDAFLAGMVSELVDSADGLMAAATQLAEKIAALPPLAVQGTKQTLGRLLHHCSEEILTLGLQLERDSMLSKDVVEATNAFREKRPGDFRGR